MSPAYHLTYPSPAHSHWYASRDLSHRRRPDPHHAVSFVNGQGWTIAASEPNSSRVTGTGQLVSLSHCARLVLVLDFDLQLNFRGRAAGSVVRRGKLCLGLYERAENITERQAVSARSLLHVVGVTLTVVALHKEVGVGMFLVAVVCS